MKKINKILIIINKMLIKDNKILIKINKIWNYKFIKIKIINLVYYIN